MHLNFSIPKDRFSKSFTISLLFIFGTFLLPFVVFSQKTYKNATIENLKEQAMRLVAGKEKQVQEMVDMIFSFSELGFQEYETSKYLTGILEKNGFKIETKISGIPTAWMAVWGKGSPVIALGSDVDCIPKASQKPGVAYKEPIVEGAPGHGEGHNSGQAVIIFAALAVKELMEKNNIEGTLVIWPGIAEEVVGSKAWYVRDGYFKKVDACIFTHVGSEFTSNYGDNGSNGIVSVRFDFSGDAAHSAANPWRGKSALDAVELMNTGWNYKREHLKPTQRSHYVIVDGGDQPNVVPSKASVWYFFRERNYFDMDAMYKAAIDVANGASMMTDTKMSYHILGTAWPKHFNKALAEVMYANIKKVGFPKWSNDDQQLAVAVQKLIGPPDESANIKFKGLNDTLEPIRGSVPFSWGGGSDDIGDISWNVPTVELRYPANIPGLKGHHWGNAIAMATPIAHKGTLAGAKATALTLIDFFTKPEVLQKANDYFLNVQTKNNKYIPFINDSTPAAIHLNEDIMKEFRPGLEKYYYNPAKYKTYLEQLGITYPTLEKK